MGISDNERPSLSPAGAEQLAIARVYHIAIMSGNHITASHTRLIWLATTQVDLSALTTQKRIFINTFYCHFHAEGH